MDVAVSGSKNLGERWVRFLLCALLLVPLISQSLMDLTWGLLLVSILGIYFFQRRQGRVSWAVSFSGVEKWWLGWAVAVFLGFYVNGKMNHDLVARTLEASSVMFFVPMILAAFQYVKLDLKQALMYSVRAILILSLVSLTLFFFSGEKRLGGLIQSAMPLAHIYGMIFCFFSTIFLFRWGSLRSTGREFWIWSVSLGVMALVLLLSLTRGVWFAVAIVLVAMAFLLSRRRGLMMVGGLTVGVGALLLVWEKFRNRFFFVFKFQQTHDSERLVLWTTNYAIIKDHLWLGAGYGENTKLLPVYYEQLGYPADQFVSHAHNQFIHILAGTGLIGFLFYLAMHFYFLRLAWVLFRDGQGRHLTSQVALGSFAALLALQIGGMTEANFEHSKVRLFVFLIWGLILYLRAHGHRWRGA